MTATLTVNGLSVNRGARTVLNNVSFSLQPGITCLLGSNGIGKSTLVESLLGLIPRKEGSVLLNGQELTSSRDLLAKHTGYLPQNFQPDPHYKLQDFLAYICWSRGLGSHTEDLVAQSLAAVNLDDRAKSRCRTLSGGMRQHLGIASATIHSPDLLLLDEPTVGLDPTQRHEFRQFINRIAENSDTTILYSTHLTDDVSSLGTHVVMLNSHGIAFQGTVEEFGGENPTPASIEEAFLERADSIG